MTYLPDDLPDYYNKGFPVLRLAMCQVLTREWAVEENLARTLTAIDQAADEGAELAVTPECVIQGYPVPETREKPEFFRESLLSSALSAGGPVLKAVAGKAMERGIFVLLGYVEKGVKGELYNSATLIDPSGKQLWTYRKVHCRHFESIEHWGFFTPGTEFAAQSLDFRKGSFRLGTMICFDRELPETWRCLRALGAEIILCPLATDTVAMPLSTNIADNEMITRTGSASNELFTVVVNHAGRFNGGSFITGPLGELLCQMDQDPGVLTIDIPAGAVTERFHREPLGWMGWGYRRPGIYKKYI